MADVVVELGLVLLKLQFLLVVGAFEIFVLGMHEFLLELDESLDLTLLFLHQQKVLLEIVDQVNFIYHQIGSTRVQ